MSLLSSILRSPRHRMLTGLGLGFVGMVVFLIASTPPWKGAAAKAVLKGRHFTLDNYIQVGLWWAGLGVAILLAALLLTLPIWWKWTEAVRPISPEHPAPPPQKRRWEWWLLGAALIVGFIMRLPLVNQGIWIDEHDNLRRNFHGFTGVGEKGQAEIWHPAGYKGAVFENVRNNNPFLFSILSHTSIGIWQKCTGAAEDRFNAVAMRIPALLCGLGGLVTAWLLFRRISSPAIAALALWLLVFHPLHIRYSVEARGYCLILLLAPVFLSSALSLIQRGTWSMAFATAFSAAGLLYSFPGAVYFVAAAGAGLILATLWKGEQRSPATFCRMMIAGLLAVGMLAFLLCPPILQSVHFMGAQFEKTGLPAPWYMQTWQWMNIGVFIPTHDEFYALRDGKQAWSDFLPKIFHAEFFSALVGLVILPLLTIIGLKSWWRQGRGLAVIAAASLGGPALFLFHHVFITHFLVFQWYMIYSLPSLVLVQASGLKCIFSRITKVNWAYPAAATAFVGIFFLATQPRTHPQAATPARWEIDHGLPTAHTDMQRGPNIWRTYADGRVLRMDEVRNHTEQKSSGVPPQPKRTVIAE